MTFSQGVESELLLLDFFCDVWMMRAAGMDTDSPNKGQYLALSQAVRKVASDHGITPRTAQALIWIIVRGSAS